MICYRLYLAPARERKYTELLGDEETWKPRKTREGIWKNV
jgi:hypothetical protein